MVSVVSFTSIDKDEIYIKIKTAAGVIRLGYFDFNQAIRENIRNIIINDFEKIKKDCYALSITALFLLYFRFF